VDRQAIESYILRAVTAETVSELHAIAHAARRAHPEDAADVDVVERVCWAAVSHLFTAARARRRSPRPAPRPLPRARPRDRDAEPFDWKARAAGM
jgi:hypothetical protein